MLNFIVKVLAAIVAFLVVVWLFSLLLPKAPEALPPVVGILAAIVAYVCTDLNKLRA